MKIKDILKLVRGLKSEEKAQIKEALNSTPAEEEPVVEEVAEQVTEEPTGSNEETVEEVTMEKEPVEPVVTEESGNDDIPQMSKTAEMPEEEVAEEQPMPMMDDEGAEMPIDNQDIIDGLNAKILALEAENKQLKSKQDEAFGIVSRPSGNVGVKSLYGDTSDIPKMKR